MFTMERNPSPQVSDDATTVTCQSEGNQTFSIFNAN